MCGIIGLIGQFKHKQEELEQACERLKRRSHACSNSQKERKKEI